MAFDILRYRKKYQDFYGDTPLEDVAKDAYQRGYHHGEPDYETWRQSAGIESLIEDDRQRRNPTFEDKLRAAVGLTESAGEHINKDRGIFGDIASRGARGVVRAAKQFGGMMRMADFDPTSDDGIVGSIGRKLTDFASKAEKYDLLKPDIGEVTGQEGLIKRGFLGAIESMPASLLPFAAGAVGAVAGGPVGALVAGGATLFGTFGLGQYQNTYDETVKQLREKGTPEHEIDLIASKHSFTDAAAEVGGEVVGDLAALTFFGALGKKAVSQAVSKTIKELVSSGGIKEFMKAVAKQAPFEAGSEMGTAYFQTESARKYGLTDMSTGEAVAESILPAVFMSLIFGGSIRGMQAVEAHNLYKKINSQNPMERSEAAVNLAQRMEDQESQKIWLETANKYIEAGQEIPLSKPIVDFATQKADQDATPQEEIEKGKARAGFMNAIDKGLSSGEYEGKPFTTDHAMELIVRGQARGLFTDADLDTFKDKYPQLRDGLNVLIADNITKKINETVTNTVTNTTENLSDVAKIEEPSNPEAQKLQEKIARTESFLARHAGDEGTQKYNKYLKMLEKDRLKLAELQGGEINGTLQTETTVEQTPEEDRRNIVSGIASGQIAPEDFSFADNASPSEIHQTWNELVFEAQQIEEANKPKIDELKKQLDGFKGRLNNEAKAQKKSIQDQIDSLKAESQMIIGRAENAYELAQEKYLDKLAEKAKSEGITADRDTINEAFMQLSDGRAHDVGDGRTWTQPLADQVMEYLKTESVQARPQQEEGKTSSPLTEETAEAPAPLAEVKKTSPRDKAIADYRSNLEKHSPKTAEEFTNKIVSLIDSKDNTELRKWMNGINPNINKLFTSLTGLPAKTQKEADASLRSLNSEKWDNEQKSVSDEKEKSQRDRAQKAVDEELDKKVRFNGKAVSKRELYESLIGQGFTEVVEKKVGAATRYKLANPESNYNIPIDKKIEADYLRKRIEEKKTTLTKAPEGAILKSKENDNELRQTERTAQETSDKRRPDARRLGEDQQEGAENRATEEGRLRSERELKQQTANDVSEEYLYHATSENHIIQITEEGLDPEKSGNYYYINDTSQNIFLAKETGYALNFNDVLLRVNKKYIDKKHLTEIERDAGTEYKYKKKIPPKNLEIYLNGEWQALQVAYVPNSATVSEGKLVPAEVPKEDVLKPEEKMPAEAITSPKEQKKYLLEKIDEAIPLASDEVPERPINRRFEGDGKIYKANKEKFGTVTIEVPDDGTFTILNTKSSLEQFKKQAQRFPASVIKGAPELKTPQPSTRPTGKRIEQEGVSYYNDFKPRKQGLITDKEEARNWYTDNRYTDEGFYTNGHYAVKTGKPNIKLNETKPIPEIKRAIPSDLFPAKTVAEFHTGDTVNMQTAAVHVVGDNGVEVALNAHYVDAILTLHPEAKVFVSTSEKGPVAFKTGDEVVGIVMPIRDAAPSKEFIGELRDEAEQQTQTGIRRYNESVNTEDAGEELTYNKRNRIKTGIKWEDIADKNTALKVKETTKQNVYPKPDYRQMIDDGMEPLVAHIVKQAYDAIPIKPQLRSIPTDEQLQKYITGVNRIMDGALRWANDKDALAALATKEARYAGAALGKVTNLTDIAKPVKSMLDTVYPEGYKNYLDDIRILGGNATLKALQPGYEQLKKAVKEIKAGWPVPQESWQKQGYQIVSGNNLKADYYSGKDVKSDKPYTYAYVMTVDSYDINHNLERKKFDGIETKDDPAVQGYVKDRLAALKDKQILVDRRYNLIGAYDSLEEAREAAREKVKRETKPTINEKGISVKAAQRTGAARRESGENISSDKLRDTFGFKGINFGNWLKGDTNEVERQLHLNHSYDSFMDLAEILNVPPQALSLNGMLGVAIGAQGSGRHAAHFVPGVNEINLTRTAGAGAIAHEWGHALDHYFATQAGLEGSKRPYLTEHKGPFESGLRPEIADLFNKIITTMNKKTVDITPEEQIAQETAQKEDAKKRVDGWLRSIKGDFIRAGVDEAAFDKLADRIRNFNLGGERTVLAPSSGSHRRFSIKFYMNPVVAELRNLYKEKTGRAYNIENMKALQSNIDHYKYLNDKETAEHTPQQREVSTDYAKEAAGLDKGKSKSYWNTNVEKFARAFDAFITDTIEENAAKNTYLSGIEAAPPKGEERIAINKAFQDLVNEIKTKETDKGVAMYSVNESAILADAYSAEGTFDRLIQNAIIENKGDQNERERFTSNDSSKERRKRDNLLPEISQERERRVGVERSVISRDDNAPVRLREACQEGRGLIYYPDGYDMPEHSRAKVITDAHGLDLIPVFDETNCINAFIRNGSVFLNMNFVNQDVTIEQAVSHEIAHYLNDSPDSKKTRRKINVRSDAFVKYRRELSRRAYSAEEYSQGKRLPALMVVEEFAADLEAGIETHYGVNLKDGLFPGSTINTIQERMEKGKYATAQRGGTYQLPSLADVQDIFKGQEVIQTDSGYIVNLVSGKGVLIQAVNHITPDRAILEIGYSKTHLSDTEVIAGHYKNGKIELVKGVADKWTLAHESVHFMEDFSIITPMEASALRRHIQNLERDGKFKTKNKEDIGGHEDRANFIADALNKPPKGLLGRIINKINDFIDKLVNLVVRTPRGIVRDIQTGEIYKEQRPILQNAFREIYDEEGAGTGLYSTDTMAEPFYSQLINTVTNKIKEMPSKVQSIPKWLERQNVKPAEMKWMGVEQWLKDNAKDGVIDKQKFADFLKENQIEIREVTKERSVFDRESLKKQMEAEFLEEARDYRFSNGDYWFHDIKEIKNEIAKDIAATEEKVISNEGKTEYIYTYGKEERSFEDPADRDDLLEEFEISDEEAFKQIPKEVIESGAQEVLKQADFTEELDEAQRDFERDFEFGAGDNESAVKFSQWQLPGGENYRVLLFVMPGLDYQSAHWSEKGVLAHVRMNDRTDADGNKVLYLEEAQSDWHQEGKKTGYKRNIPLNEYDEDNLKNRDLVPPAPFAENWHEMAMKRMLRYAAENGYDKLAWTTPESEINKYGTDRIAWKQNAPDGDGKISWNVSATELSGGQLAGVNLEEYAREKGVLLEGQKDVADKKTLSGLIRKKLSRERTSEELDDLTDKIWAKMQTRPEGVHMPRYEGMKAFYGDKIPGFMNKYVKQWGAKVGTTEINTDSDAVTAPSVDITPAMKHDVLFKGQAYYALGQRFSEKVKGQYSIRNQQDPPVSKDPKVLGLYLKDEKDAIVQTIINKLHPKSMTWLEMMLKSPEWFDHPQIQKIVRLFMRDRDELYHETFNDLNLSGDSTVTEEAKALRNKGLSLKERLSGKVSQEYKVLTDMIDDGDTNWTRDTRIPLDKQLKSFEDVWRKKGATDAVISVWKSFRQSYDKALDLMTQQLRDMIAELTEEARSKGETPDLSELRGTLKGALADMNQWRGFYAPRQRERGNWAVQAYKEHGPLTQKREWYRAHKASEREARREAKRLERDGWKIHRIGEVEKLPEDVYQDVRAVATAKLIDTALDKYAKKNKLGEENAAKLNEDVLREISNMIKARGFRGTMIHRGRGNVVRGFVEDPIERHVMYINSVAGGISKARVARLAMKELLGEKVNGEQVGGIDPVADPQAYTVATNYIQEQLRNLDATDRIIGLAKSVATFKFLGFNLRSLAVNMTAIATTAVAAIHQYAMGGKGSLTSVLKELAISGKDFGSFMAGKKLDNAEEQALLEDSERKGWTDAQYMRDALGTIQGIYSRVWSSMMDASMYLFGVSEKWNRGTTMLAAYRLARKNGMNHAEAAEAAKTASDNAHGSYGRATLPMLAQGANPAAKIGQMLYVYAKFPHNYLQMLYDLGFKKRNIKGAMFAFLSPLVLAGGAAFPFKDAIFAFAGFILGLLGFDRDPEKWVWDQIRQHLGGDAERIGRHGLTGAMGIDISGSLSIGVGIPKDFIDLTGAIGGVVTDIKEAGESLANKEPGRAAEQLLPTGFANPLRAIRESEQGATTRNRRRVWDEKGKPYIPGTGASIVRGFGFRSAEQAVLSERTWEGHRQQGKFADRRNRIYERYRAWLLGERDREEYKKIVKEVQDFNRYIRENKIRGESFITSQSLRNQVRRMMRPSKKDRSILEE